MNNENALKPESTAERVALWRALHVQIDAPPHVLEDEIGLQLIDPDPDWRQRQDMDPQFTKRLRADIVARARFIEDLVISKIDQGVTQYAILGAGLDTFAQRKPDIASRLDIFEIDQLEPQKWKQKRLKELEYGIPDWLHFIPVDFETESWWDKLTGSKFQINSPSIVASAGVSHYITKKATRETLRNITSLAPGSTVIMTFILPMEFIEEEDRQLQEISMKGAKASGTPFISFYTPEEIEKMALEVGFQKIEIITKADLVKRYFSDRNDSLEPASGESILVATT